MEQKIERQGTLRKESVEINDDVTGVDTIKDDYKVPEIVLHRLVQPVSADGRFL